MNTRPTHCLSFRRSRKLTAPIYQVENNFDLDKQGESDDLENDDCSVEDHHGLDYIGNEYNSERGDSTDDVSDNGGENDEEKIDVAAKVPQHQAKEPYTTRVGLPSSYRFHIDLTDILGRHRTDLKLYDEIIDLVQNHSNRRELKFSSNGLRDRKGFIKKLQESFDSSSMRPKDIDVELSSGEIATVSVFDIEAMILSLIQDKSLMKEENLGSGYSLHTGKSTEPSTRRYSYW